MSPSSHRARHTSKTQQWTAVGMKIDLHRECWIWPSSLIVGYPLTLKSVYKLAVHGNAWQPPNIGSSQQTNSFLEILRVHVFRVFPTSALQQSGFVLFAQGLPLCGAIHICNERSGTAVELIHQFVPIRFQLLAVACQIIDNPSTSKHCLRDWATLCYLTCLSSEKLQLFNFTNLTIVSHRSSPGGKELDEHTLPCCFCLAGSEFDFQMARRQHTDQHFTWAFHIWLLIWFL